MKNSPSRVVILTDFASPRGGASGLALAQAEAMAALGLNVTVIAGDQHLSAPKNVDLVSLAGKRLLDAGALQAASRGLWDRNVARLVADWIKTHDDGATIYHLHGFQQTLSPSVLRPLAKVATRLVVHAHDYFLSCPNGAFFDYQANETCSRKPMSMPCLARHCDKTSRVHKLWRVLRQKAQNNGIQAVADEATLILLRPEMASRMPHFKNTVAIANPAQAFKFPPAAPELKSSFFYIGDLNRYKGIFVLAHAARQAAVSLTFIGDGHERLALQNQFPEHRITGWLDRDGIAAELSNARAVVAPSLGPEPYGLAPVEALLSGIPVILGENMLIANEINAAGAGLKVAAGNVEALAAALSMLKTDDARINAMARAAKPCGAAISQTLDCWVESLLQIYGGILDSLQPKTLPKPEIYAIAAQ